MAEFKEPKVMDDITKSGAFANGIGIIKRTTYQREPQDFYQTREYQGKTFYEFRADLVMGDNRIRLTAQSSTNRPTFAKDLASSINDGDVVKITGVLNEYVRDGISRRSVKIIKPFEKAQMKGDGYLNVFLQGKVLSTDADIDKVTITIGIPKYNNPEEYDSYDVVVLDNDSTVQWMQQNDIGVGDYLRVRTKPMNVWKRNENGDVDTINENRLIEVLEYAKGVRDETTGSDVYEVNLNGLPF